MFSLIVLFDDFVLSLYWIGILKVVFGDELEVIVRLVVEFVYIVELIVNLLGLLRNN